MESAQLPLYFIRLTLVWLHNKYMQIYQNMCKLNMKCILIKNIQDLRLLCSNHNQLLLKNKTTIFSLYYYIEQHIKQNEFDSMHILTAIFEAHPFP